MGFLGRMIIQNYCINAENIGGWGRDYHNFEKETPNISFGNRVKL